MKERTTKKEKLKWNAIDLMEFDAVLKSMKWKESVAELK